MKMKKCFWGLRLFLVASLSWGVTAARGVETIQFSAASYTANESNATVRVTVVRAGGSSAGVTVQLDTANGTAEAGLDYRALSTNLVFASGQLSKEVRIPLLNDTIDETNETFHVRLSNPTAGAVLGAVSNAVITIVDNDAGGTLAFSVANYSISETGALATIRVVRTGGRASGVTVDYHTVDGTATAGQDYESAAGTLSFAANETNKTFRVEILDDELGEGPETVQLVLSNPTGGAVLGTRNTALLTIMDNEQTLQFSKSNYTNATESGSTTISVIRTGPTTGTVSVQYATSAGTATPGTDYIDRVGTLKFLPGEKVKTFSVPVVADTLDEADETVNLTLTNPVGALLGPQNTAVLTILDNDVGGVIRFRALTNIVAESSTFANIAVIRTGGKASGVTVQFSTANGTAAGGEDYVATTTNLVFAANVTSLTVRVPIINDTVVEGNETVQLTLSNPTGGATLGEPATAILSIMDDDVGGRITFTHAFTNVSETVGTVFLTVVRTNGAAGGVGVTVTAVGGTATLGTDYSGVPTNLVFQAGETRKTVALGIVNDVLVEGNETVQLALMNPIGGATLGPITTNLLTIVEGNDAMLSRARQRWEAWDFAGALADYREVLASDPTNKAANVGLAILSVALLPEHPQVAAQIRAFGQNPPTVPQIFDLLNGNRQISEFFGFPLPELIPMTSDVQGVITNAVLPVLNEAISALKKVEGKGFVFELTPAMTGDTNMSVSVFLDDGEFYAYDAVLSAVSAWARTFTAYHLDCDLTLLDMDPLSVLNGPWGQTNALSVKFFTLKSGGAAAMQAALAAVSNGVLAAKSSYTFIRSNDTDAATDNGITLPALDDENEDGVINEEDARIRDQRYYQVFNMLRAAFVQKMVVSIPTDDTTNRVNGSKFFTAPLDRTDLPRLVYDLPPDPTLSEMLGRPVHVRLAHGDTDGDGNAIGDEDDEFVISDVLPLTPLPDPTFNGLLPDGIGNLIGRPGQNILPALRAFLVNIPGTDVGHNFSLAAAPAGRLLLAERGSNIIYTLTTNGNVESTMPLWGLYSVDAVGVHQGRVWVATSSMKGYGLYRLNTDGTFDTYVPLSVYWPRINALASDGVNLWVSMSGRCCTTGAEIWKYNATTGWATNPLFATADPRFESRAFANRHISGLTFDGTNLLAAVGGPLLKIDRTTGSVLSEKWSFTDFEGSIALVGDKLYSGVYRRPHRIYVFQP